MMRKVAESLAGSLADTAMLLRLSLRLQLGRGLWLIPVLALLWPSYLTGFGNVPSRWSPLFNPLVVKDASETQMLAWTVQNRIGFALLIVSLVTLTCARGAARKAPEYELGGNRRLPGRMPRGIRPRSIQSIASSLVSARSACNDPSAAVLRRVARGSIGDARVLRAHCPPCT